MTVMQCFRCGTYSPGAVTLAGAIVEAVNAGWTRDDNAAFLCPACSGYKWYEIEVEFCE